MITMGFLPAAASAISMLLVTLCITRLVARFER